MVSFGEEPATLGNLSCKEPPMKATSPQFPNPPESGSHGRTAARPGFFRPRNLLFILAALVLLVIAAILIAPNFISYRHLNYNSAAKANVKNAYTASQAYFSDYPDGSVDAKNLTTYGFTQTFNVFVTIQGSTKSTLSVTAKHRQSPTTYTVDSTGTITKGAPSPPPWWQRWFGLDEAKP